MKPIITLFRRKTVILLQGLCLVTAASCVLASEPLTIHSPDGHRIAAADASGRILYRLKGSATVKHTFYTCHLRALAFAENGHFFAAAGGKNGSSAKIKVWRTSDHKQLCEILISSEGARLIAVSPDGRPVVGIKPDDGVAAWRASDGKPQWSGNISSMAKSVRFSADGKLLRVQCEDGSDWIIDSVSGRKSA
jgi:WD40 repeat protein